MRKTVTLREVNRNFAKCIRDVESGQELIITRRGVPVAKLSPAGRRRVLTPEQEAALERTRKRLEKGWPLGAWKISRDEIHDG